MENTSMSANWGLIGHEWAVEILRQQILHDAVHHAYLFTGPRGVGRRTLALRFLQAMNCEHPLSPSEPCRTCRTCSKIADSRYENLTVLEAEKEGGTLSIEKIREVRRRLTLKPFLAGRSAALFLRFHEASLSASNALLKTLEETPGSALIILTADAPEQLMPTITSRCEILRLRPLKVEDLENSLQQRGVGAEKAQLLAHLSGGRPGYSLHLQEDEKKKEEEGRKNNTRVELTELAFRKQKMDEMQVLLHASRVERFTYAEKLTARKKKDRDNEAEERLRRTLLFWLSFWRDVLLRVGRSGAPLENIDYASAIDSLVKRLSLPQAAKLAHDAREAVERLDHNINARLLAEITLLDWPKIP